MATRTTRGRKVRPQARRKSRASAGAKRNGLARELADALAQQAATAEILRVIRASPTDIQPALEAIARCAAGLFAPSDASIHLVEGDQITLRAHVGPHAARKDSDQVAKLYPLPSAPEPGSIGRLIALKRVATIADTEAPGVHPRVAEIARAGRFRSILSVPLASGDAGIGAISLSHPRPRFKWSERQRALLQTFADQAVIAIENVRLFNETREALERQTATAEILRVIASSPADTQPVFDAIVNSVSRLFGRKAALRTVEADGLRRRARSYDPEPGEYHGREVEALDRTSIVGRAVLEGRTLQWKDTLVDGAAVYGLEHARQLAFRSIASAPLMLKGRAIGVISVSSPNPGALSEKQMEMLATFADQAVIAIENVRLFNETKEALEQQTATAEVLRAISGSPSDLRPILDTLVNAASRFCGAPDVALMRLEGDVLRGGAAVGPFAGVLIERLGAIEALEIPVNRQSVTGRAVVDRRVVHVEDLAAESEDEFPVGRDLQRRFGHRTMVSVPLLREGVPLGVISLFRADVRPFSEKQLGLLKVFADQAVIAIENVRLFNETKEALERQTATAEILKVISSSPTDVQPVFDAMCVSAARLCEAYDTVIWRVEGNVLRVSGHHGNVPVEDLPLVRGTSAGRAVLDREVHHVLDLQSEDGEFPQGAEVARRLGVRTVLGVPLLREGQAIGIIGARRSEARYFSERQIDLLKTFADQAVIAIENVRLFNETREALERQTATAEILKVISRSPTDVQPVFDAIAQNAARLFDGWYTSIVMRDGDMLRLGALAGPVRGKSEPWKGLFPLKFLPDQSLTARTIHEQALLEVSDTEAPGVPETTREGGRRGGYRSVAFVPLVREGEGIGIIGLARPEPGHTLTEKQKALIQTFADQAVIAIENVRLFNETKEALEHQTATTEVLQVISSSVADTTPVFDKIIQSCAKLFGVRYANVALLRDDGMIHLIQDFASADLVEWEIAHRKIIQAQFPRPARDSIHGYAIHKREVLHYPDVANGPGVPAGLRASVTLTGDRGNNYSALFAPMMWEGKGIGAIGVHRNPPSPFADKDIRLLKTFADQAAIAIQNARLFNETKEALERQTATAEILRVIASSPADVQPVFDTIAKSALALCKGLYANVFRYDGELLHFMATESLAPRGVELMKAKYPMRPDASQASGRVILSGADVCIEDLSRDPDYDPRLVVSGGPRRMLGVPMLREGTPLGAIVVAWREPGPVSKHHEELLRTFADQAVIAIENVRLFNETKEALERQTATAEILRVISRSTTDLQPVFDAIAESSLRLLQGWSVIIWRLEGQQLQVAAVGGGLPGSDGEVRKLFGTSEGVTDATFLGDAVSSREPRQILDSESEEVSPRIRETARVRGWRSNVAVPMLQGGNPIGAITLSRAQPGGFAPREIEQLQTFADQAMIAIENVRLFNETKEALERQTATAAVLRVISASPVDVSPVFAEILEHATQLCEAQLGFVFTSDGSAYEPVAQRGLDAEQFAAWSAAFHANRVAGPMSGLGRVLATRAPVHIADVADDEAYRARDPMRVLTVERLGARTFLAVPLLTEGAVIGAVVIYRREVRPFSDKQVLLLQTFADQAVIAIENVRLFNETKEALERQTATAEILKVIARSPADIQPVFEAIAESAHRLFGRKVAFQIARDGALHVGAVAGFTREGLAEAATLYPMPMVQTRGMRAMLDGQLLETTDVEIPGTPAAIVKIARALKFRSIVTVPLLREGELLGVLSLTAGEVRPKLDDNERGLLKTFADQAMIAIENVRLFRELQQRTEALTKSVGQLTALGEVGQAISSTLDLETVLKTIVSRAVQLTGLDGGSVYEYDERAEEFHLRATENVDEEYLAILRRTPIRKGEGAVGRAALAGEPTQIPDVRDQSYQSRMRDAFIRAGYRAILVVPLRREDHVIGALAVTRKSPGPFADEVVELLKTFATQSAMAIQNARLFREIAEKGRQLEEASRHKSQFLASMSHELRTPLNAILGFNEMILGEIYGEVPADMKGPLEDIQTSGKHLLRLINNVLDLAKIEAGRMELALADYSVHDTVESVRSTLRPLAAEKGLEFLASVSNDIPLAYGDSGRITQCLMNLAGNSLKFTKVGKVEISVGQKDGLLTYRVADTGIGIPPDKIGNLFTEFKQTDATVASEYGGTGLGLSISRKFVEMHGGRIWVESEPGKGSAFIFEIPLRAGGGAQA